MKRPNVETLIAYAKGTVTPEKARQIEAFLDSNSDARQAIEDFRRMLQLPPAAPSTHMETAQRRRAGTANLRPPRSQGAQRIARSPGIAKKPKWMAALAASLAVIAALGLGGFLMEGREESPMALGRLSTIDTLSVALMRQASGAPDMAGDRAVTMLMTFRDEARRACRKFEISETSPTAPRILAVACQDNGAWRIEGAAWQGNAYSQALSESVEPLAALLKKLGAGQALTPEAEAALIGRNWQGETQQ